MTAVGSVRPVTPETLTEVMVRDYLAYLMGGSYPIRAGHGEVLRRVADGINALREYPCCPHPVERHAYSGCANCGCAVPWSDHPGRLFDTAIDAHTRGAVDRARRGTP